MTGETQDEWIAAVDLASSFHVLSYSVAATPVGGVGKQEVERGRLRQTEMPQGLCKGAEHCRLHGKKKKLPNNLLYTSLTRGIKHYKCEHNPPFNEWMMLY